MRPDHPLKRTHHTTVILGMFFSLVIGLGALSYALFVVLPNMLVSDEVAPGYDDLALQPLTLKPNENGYPALHDAIVAADMSASDAAAIDAIVENRSWTDAEAVALVKKYDEPLRIFRESADAVALVNPIYATEASAEAAVKAWLSKTNFGDPSLPYNDFLHASFRTYTRLAIIAAEQQAHAGKVRSGLLELAAAARVNEKLANGRQNLIGLMLTMKNIQEVLEAIINLGARSTLTADDVQLLTKALPTNDLRLGTIAAYQLERVVGMAMLPSSLPALLEDLYIGAEPSWIDALTIGFGAPWYAFPVQAAAHLTGQTDMLYLPKQTKRLAFAHARDTIWRLAKDCDDESLAVEARTELNDGSFQWRPLTTPNYTGRMILQQGLWPNEVHDLNQRRCNLQALTSMTTIAFAMLAAEDANENLPSTVSDLSPTYLTDLPTDPYTDRAFAYDRTNRTLQSLGIERQASSNNPTVKILSKNDLAANPAGSTTNMYYVALDDDGRTGEKIGCGDSIVPVARALSLTNRTEEQKMRIALESLLADKATTVIGTSYRNALAESTLRINQIAFDNATQQYVVALSGTLVSGGTCDDPRIIAQLTRTVAQFAPNNGVTITVNGTPLATLLSGRGE